MPTVTIDGIPVQVEAETTLLEAARQAGVWIPTLCHHPAVSNVASCRICMVEVDRGSWRQLVTACNYPVRGDVTAWAMSDTAIRARQGVMELLLARAPESEELRALAARMGVNGTPYPTVTESQRNCILCGLCIRVCEEMIGHAAIGFIGRGVERVVSPPFRQANDACNGCGACAAVCPVGTIQMRMHPETGEVEVSPFKSRARMQTCTACGANLVTEPVAGEVLEKVAIDWDEFRQRAGLCPSCRRKHVARTSLMQSQLKSIK